MRDRIIPRMDFEGIEFGDRRLNERLLESVEQMTKKPGESTLGSGGGRTNAKGFYRLLGNPKFDLKLLQEQEKGITIERMKNQKTVLLIQDTTDVNLNTHKKTEGLGYCSEHVLGIKLHTCLGFTTDGFPLGVLGQTYETREKEKNAMPKSELTKRPIEEKESFRWLEMLENSTKDIPAYIEAISIIDREGDFYELYSKASQLTQKYIIRVTHNRRTATGDKLIDKVHAATPNGEFSVTIPRDSRNNKPARTAEMEVAFCGAEMLKPIIRNEPDLLPSIHANVVRITEKNVEDPIEWILMTNLNIETAEDCKRIVEYYALRWQIERFHFVLKSGCNIEKIQQRTYERIKPVIFIYSVIALYIMTITFIGRLEPDASCAMFFYDIEWKLLYQMGKKQQKSQNDHTL